MIFTKDLRILYWLPISPFDCLDLCNLKMDKIVAFEYLRLKLLALEKIIEFEILVIKKIRFEYSKILFVQFDQRF